MILKLHLFDFCYQVIMMWYHYKSRINSLSPLDPLGLGRVSSAVRFISADAVIEINDNEII